MKRETIPIEEIIGKTITDIRCKYGQEDGWLDTAGCFIELDHQFYMEIPYGQAENVSVVTVDPDAKTVFGNPEDIPIYHVNKDDKSIAEVMEAHEKQDQSFFNRLRNAIFRSAPLIKDYKPYRITYQENKLKYLLHQKIAGYWWEEEDHEKGFFELGNGCFISEQNMAPHGTGLAGLHLYDNLDDLKARKGENLIRLQGNP